MAVLPLAFLLVASQAPAASVWHGPGLLCGAVFSIQLESGEIAWPISEGIHQRSAALRTAAGELVYQEFESLLASSDPELGLTLASDFIAHPIDDGGRRSYRLFERRGLRLILSGAALDGSDRDRAVLERFRHPPDDARLCTYSFSDG